MDHADLPIYQRIADDLRRAIVAGQYVEGDRLPSIPDLIRTYGVTSNTAQAAIRTLATEGYVTRRSGSGTYVRARREPEPLTRFQTGRHRPGSPFAAEMQARGRRGSWDFESSTIQAPEGVRDRLGIVDPEGDAPDVLRTRYVYRSDGNPAMLATSYEPLDVTRGTPIVVPEEGPHAGRGVVERMLVIGVRIDDTSETVGARVATTDEAARLQLSPGAVVLTIRRSYTAGDRIVEIADIVLPAERYELVYAWRIEAAEPGESS